MIDFGAAALTASRPTILQLIPRLDTGGAEQTTIDIVDALVKAGARALVATEGGRMAAAVTARGGELLTLPVASKNPATMLWNSRRIAALCQREGVDLIHARSRAPAWSGLMAARRLGLPFVTTYHGAYGGSSALKTWYNGVMARGVVVIANSNYTARLIAGRHKTPSDQIRVIPRGVDLARFDPAAVSPDRLAVLRARWGVRPEQPVILKAARLTSWKGQRVLIEAAGLLARDGRLGEAVVVLAGDPQGRDGYVDELKARIAVLGLGGRVVLGGHCDDMPAAFLAAAVSVIASTEPEAFGRVATESLAMGTPVVVTDLGAPPETLAMPADSPDRLGWVVPSGDAPTLATALTEVLAMSPDERTRFAAVARAHVAQGFSLERMQAATLAVYDGLLGTGLGDFGRELGVRL